MKILMRNKKKKFLIIFLKRLIIFIILSKDIKIYKNLWRLMV